MKFSHRWHASVCEAYTGHRRSLLMGGPSHGRQVGLPQWGDQGDGVRAIAARLCQRPAQRQSAALTQGALRSSASTTSVEREAVQVALGTRLQALHC
jgi:hypothetical protein